MILVDQLTKRYGHYTAVDSISFSLPPGTVTGFLGANGAGIRPQQRSKR
jgi:ABC-2 type transport system ATP-binding protein